MAPGGDLIELVYEDRAARFQVGHHVGVVHYLFTYVDRPVASGQCLLDGPDGALYAGTERARERQQDRALPRRSAVDM